MHPRSSWTVTPSQRASRPSWLAPLVVLVWCLLLPHAVGQASGDPQEPNAEGVYGDAPYEPPAPPPAEDAAEATQDELPASSGSGAPAPASTEGEPAEVVGGDTPSLEMGETGVNTEIEYGVSRARPMRGFRFGDLNLAFMLASSLSVDDNVFRLDEDEEVGEDGDVSFINVPGVRMDWFLGEHDIMAEYRMELQSYADHDDLDYIDHFYDVQGHFNFEEVYVNLGDRLQTLTDPDDLALAETVERTDHTVNVALGMRHQRLSLEIGYQHEFLDFSDGPYQHIDHQEDYVSVLGAYQLNARWEMTFDYRYGERDYEENVINDSHVNVIRGGLRGFLTRNLEWTGKVGFEEVTPESGGLIDDENDYHGVAAATALEWQISPLTSLTAAYERTTKYGSFAAYEIINDVELKGSHQVTPDLRVGFSVWWRDNDPSKGPRRNQWGLRTGADYEIKPWWHVSAEGIFRWQQSDATADLFVLRRDGHVLGPAGSVGSLDYDNAQFLLSSLIVF